MPHATLLKFGYPEGMVQEYAHWCVLLRPAQVTLGSLVLVNRSEAAAFGDLGPEAFAEMEQVIRDIEHTLKALFSYDRINYLMLMMVDPQVHCHVLPRYASARDFAGSSFTDPSWPKPADLGQKPAMEQDRWDALLGALRDAWPT